MKRKFWLLAASVLMIFVLAACGSDKDNESKEDTNATGEETTNEDAASADEITIKHELGNTTIAKNPETVVVFDYGALETLDKLGVEVAGVPQGNLPSYLEK